MTDPTFTYTHNIGGTVHKFINWDYFATINGDRRYLYFRSGNVMSDNCTVTATGGRLRGSFAVSLTDGHDYVPFADIRSHWGQAAITYGVEQQLFNGVSASEFAPNANMTRAMFVTVLGRLYEARGGYVESFTDELSFTDVNRDAYYYPYLAWAVKNRLISGYDGEHFAPNDSITREQLATITANFMVRLYDGVTPTELSFSDVTSISDWAVSGVSYCTAAGLVGGFEDNTFRPAARATRAQVAAIMQRLAGLLL